MIIKKVTITTALLAVGVITSLGYGAVAQTNRPAPSPNQSAPMPESPNKPGTVPDRTAPLPNQSAPMRNRPAQRPSANQLSGLDRQFVMDAAQGGMAEVQLAQLALERSSNAEVKEFAQQMIEQHTQANKELMSLATQKGITPPTTVGSKYEAAMAQLMQLSGASFDKAYMNEAGVNGHLEAAAVYQRQAAMGQDPELRAFAAKILPTVQGHLEMAGAMTGYSLFAQRNNARPAMSMPGMTGMPGMPAPARSMPGMTAPASSIPEMPGMPAPARSMPQ